MQYYSSLLAASLHWSPTMLVARFGQWGLKMSLLELLDPNDFLGLLGNPL